MQAHFGALNSLILGLDVLLPRLPALAQYLVEAVPRRLNSPLRILSGMQDAASEVEKIP